MKRLLSVVLSLMILMSTMVTGFSVGAASTDKATINGKEVAVGSKVTYKLDLKTSTAIEAIEGVVKYDSSILKVDSFTMPNTTTNLITNTNIAGEIYYSAYGIDNAFDFSSQKNYFTAVFTVVSAGTCNTTHEWSVLDDTNEKTLLNGSGQVDSSKVTASYETAVSGSIPDDTAIINGVKCKVGSTITFNVLLKSASLAEDYQGHIFYTNSLLEPQSISCKYNGAPAMTNLADENSYPGKNIISYTWTDFQHPVDFKTEDKLASVQFKVKASGEGEITSYIACLDDENSNYLIDENVIVDDNTTVRTEVIASEVPTDPTTKPSSTQPAKTTFNGKEVSVGDEVTVDYYLQADKVCEDFQGYFYYGNETADNTDGIELKSMTLKDLPGTMVNTAPDGKAVFTGTSPMNPYDFTSKTKFVSATFKITKANADYFANAEMYILTAADGMEYANLGVVKNPFTWTQDSSQVSTSTKPSSSSTKPSGTTVTTPSDEYAIINGVKCKVGSTVTFNMLLKTDYKVEDYQGYVLYSEDLLEPQSLYCRETSTTAFTNLADKKHYPGRSVVAFNWLDIVNHLDFSTETVMASVKFKVTAAGTGTIEDDIIRIDDPNDVIILHNNKITSDGTTYRTETVAEEIPTSSTTKPTESSTTKPITSKTTFNGKNVSVGDEVTVSYYIQTEKLCEDFQGHFYYGNKTKDNTDGIELKSFYIKELPGLMNNTSNAGDIIFTGVSPMNPYDFTTKTKFISATFKITEENCDYFANASFEVLSAVDGTNYVNFGQIENEFVWEQETKVPTTTSTKPSSSSTKPSSSSTTKPVPATVNITNNLTNVVTNNNATSINKGDSYKAVLTPAEGYKISIVVLVVNGNVVPVSANEDGTYNIDVKATGDIVISATADKIPPLPTSTTTKPNTSKTTFNGKAVSVGDEVTVSYYIQTEKLCEDFQGHFYYGNKTKDNTDGIELKSFYIKELPGLMNNTSNAGDIIFTGVSPMNPYDFTTKTKFISATFKITEENCDYFANASFEVLSAVDGTNYVNFGQIENEFVWEQETKVPTTTSTKPSSSSTKPSSSSTKPSSSSSKPAPETCKITNNLTNVVTSNSATSVNKGSVYTTVLSPAKDYKISAVVLIVNGEVVPVSANADGTYLISVVATGDIVVSAFGTAVVPDPTTTSTKPTQSSSTTKKSFAVNSVLTNVVSTNNDKTAEEGSTYSAILAPVDGYEMVTVVATVGGQTIQPTKNGDVYIITAKVTGDISIVAYAQKKTEPTTTKPSSTTKPVEKMYNVTNNLTNVVTSNSATTVKENDVYTTILSPVKGYKISTVVVIVNGNSVPVNANTDGTYLISVSATGDISISAYATEIPPTPTTKPSSTTKPQPTSESVPKTDPTQVIEINKISLNKTTATVKEGQKINLVASIWPGYTTEKTVTWSVNNSRIGVVSQTTNTVLGLYDEEGKNYCTETATFTAKSSGQVVVKAVTNTGLVAKCVITVKSVATSLSVNKTSVTVNKGKTATVKATVGPNSIPSQYKSVSWTTSNKKVATVSSKGVIKGIAKGTCYVTATSKDNTSLKKKIKVTVKQPVTSVKFNKSSVSLAKKNASTKLKATVSPSNANVKKLTIKSENTKIAKVSKSSINSGSTFKVTAVKKGTTYVRATATDGSKKYARIKVTVKK